MRAELKKVLAEHRLWDERVGILQITDATAGFVRVRILVSAADSASLFDLRCLIREELVLFLQQDHPTALPHVRLESLAPLRRRPGRPAPPTRPDAAPRPSGPARSPPPTSPAGTRDPHDSQLFTGSIEAIQRSKAFSGPGEEVFEDRDKRHRLAELGAPGHGTGQVFPAPGNWSIIRRWRVSNALPHACRTS